MSSLSPVRAVRPSETIVRQVASRERVDPIELDPLYGAIDPDALDALVLAADRNGSALRIEFVYHGHRVTVTDGGEIRVDRAAPGKRSSDRALRTG